MAKAIDPNQFSDPTETDAAMSDTMSALMDANHRVVKRYQRQAQIFEEIANSHEVMREKAFDMADMCRVLASQLADAYADLAAQDYNLFGILNEGAE